MMIYTYVRNEHDSRLSVSYTDLCPHAWKKPGHSNGRTQGMSTQSPFSWHDPVSMLYCLLLLICNQSNRRCCWPFAVKPGKIGSCFIIGCCRLLLLLPATLLLLLKQGNCACKASAANMSPWAMAAMLWHGNGPPEFPTI